MTRKGTIRNWSSGGAWDRRLLVYAGYVEECADARGFGSGLQRLLEADFPDLVVVTAYDEADRLLPDASLTFDGRFDWNRYLQQFQGANPFPDTVRRHRLQDETVIFSQWLDDGSFRRSSYYNDFLRPQRLDYALGLSVSVPGGGRITLSFLRSEGDGDYSPAEARHINRLRPMLRQALDLRSHALARSAQTVRPRSELLRTVFGLSQREVDVAECMIEGLSYKEAARYLGISFHTMVSHAKNVREKCGNRSMREVVHLLLGPNPALSDTLAERCELTRREREIAAALAAGETYAELAERLHLSRHTVCSHVKAILRKTGAASSRHLAALLARPR